MDVTVLVHLLGGLEHLEDALLGERRCEDDGEIHERGHAVVDGVLKRVDDLLVLVLHKIPLVDHHDEALVVLLDELEDVLYDPDKDEFFNWLDNETEGRVF